MTATGDMIDPIAFTNWTGPGEVISIGGSVGDRVDDTGPQGNRMIIFTDPVFFGNPPSSSPLTNQIIINADNSGGTWDGDVALNWSGGVDQNGDPITDSEIRIGPDQPQPYKAPFYEVLPSEFGGGAIGLVPFNFHTKASNPIGDQYLTVDSSTIGTAEVVIEHYGPVAENGQPEAAIRLEFYDGVDHVWEPVTDDFDVTVSGRQVSIVPASGQQWEIGIYRAEPDDLICVGATGNVQPVYDFASQVMGMTDYYVFMIMKDATGCPGNCGPGDPNFQGADTNGDGVITPGDFNAWVLAFNTGNMAADQNCDGVIAPNDFNAWILNFNGGCH